jgi:ribonuclease Z
MSMRELVILGTSSQAPTRARAHHGALLLWDGEGFLFDPGEGTQRQLIFAGVSAPTITRICITHFHGDHCLGLPGLIQRLALDRVEHRVDLYFPASGADYVDRLRGAAIFRDTVDLAAHPSEPGTVAEAPPLRIVAAALEHRVDTLGWRLEESDGRTMLPDRLEAAGVRGAEIGRLQREGTIEVDGRRVTLEEMSVERPGQIFAFVMDTALCDAAFALAEDADMLVCESTFLERDAELAREYTHLTAAQAATIASEAGVGHLVLTHFSQRYTDPGEFHSEAAAVYDGEITIASDLDRVPLPHRRSAI